MKPNIYSKLPMSFLFRAVSFALWFGLVSGCGTHAAPGDSAGATPQTAADSTKMADAIGTPAVAPLQSPQTNPHRHFNNAASHLRVRYRHSSPR